MSDLYKFLVVDAFNRTSLNITRSDFLSRNPNDFYQGSDLAWMMISSALVLLMIPGIGLFYSGSSERCSAISMLWLSMMTISVIGIQWWFCGYSIAFTGSSQGWGSSEGMFFRSSLFLPWGDKEGTKIPQIAFVLFQGIFACFTGAIISGAVIRTDEPMHFLAFIFLWTTFIYDPIARSTWHPVGFGNYWDGKGSGVFDFAGGTVVHISSATTSVVYSMWCKWKRIIFNKTRITPVQIQREIIRPSNPHNVINAMLGTTFLYVGWFGFNGGSALGANLRAVSACLSTHLAAVAGAATGTALEYWAARWRGDTGRFSVIGFCNGVLTGLVAITPAAGYVPSWSAPIFGILGAGLCFTVQDFSKSWFDIHHIFVMHGYAGFIGMMLTAAFARREIIESDGFSTFVSRKAQVGLQLADVTLNILFTTIGTFAILFLMECVIIFYLKINKLPYPGFASLDDANIIVQRELGEGFESARLIKDGEDVELGGYPGAGHAAGGSVAGGGGGGIGSSASAAGGGGGGSSDIYGGS